MFAQPIQLEYVSFFEPSEGVWREGAVGEPTDEPALARHNGDEEDFEAFCRRSMT